MMNTLETLPRNADAAVSTPTEIDLVVLVSECAKRKAKLGESFQGKKGKQSLFALACAAYRSLRGLPKFDDDGKPCQLPDSIANSIREAVASFWATKANEILSYGEIVSYRTDITKATVTDDGKVKLHLEAVLKAKRNPKDAAEFRLHCSFAHKQAQKRMDYMLDNLAKFDRDELNAQRRKVECLEKAEQA